MIPEEQFNQAAWATRLINPDTVSLTGDGEDTVRMSIIEEQLIIDKQVVETGRVRLVKTIQEDQQAVRIPLVAERVEIERVVIDQFVDEVPTTRQEGDTTIYPVLVEEYVIQKRLRLVEEIRVTKRQVQTTDQQTVVLRREEVAIERMSADPFVERSDSVNESSL